MQTERGSVVRALRSRGDHDRALQAECSLPQWVDTERDAGVLLHLDVEPSDIVGSIDDGVDGGFDGGFE